MCDICAKAGEELFQFAQELQQKYPGTTVNHGGKDYPVAPGHHVFVAAQGLAEATAIQEARFVVEQKAREAGLTLEEFVEQTMKQDYNRGVRSNHGGLFGSKVIEV